MSKVKALELSNIANGVATELFGRELQQVLENIEDGNTRAETAREITLKFTFKPSIDRDQAEIIVESKSKMAPVKIAKGQAYLSKRNGKLVAYQADVNQMDLPMDGPELVGTRPVRSV